MTDCESPTNLKINLCVILFFVQETDSGEHLSRRKSLKESIRRSFRRLRSRKGSRGGAERTPQKEGEAPASPTPEAVASPVSRLVEENRVDESVLSMVRCLYFVDTFVRDGKALYYQFSLSFPTVD